MTKLEINSETYTVFFFVVFFYCAASLCHILFIKQFISVGILTPVLSIAMLFNQDPFLK